VDRYVVLGTKKLFSLTRTKLRLAEEADTVETRPSPLPLPKLFAGVELNTVPDSRAYWQALKDKVDYTDDLSVASTTLELCDIIECVKYRFELPEYMPLINEIPSGKPLTILLLTPDGSPGALYIGEDPPPGVMHYSRVISGIAPLLHHLYRSPYLSEGTRLRNVEVRYGGRNLLGNAVNHALTAFLA